MTNLGLALHTLELEQWGQGLALQIEALKEWHNPGDGGSDG